jgi:predicted nucleic acid-binding protein
MIQETLAKVGDQDLAISAIGYTELLYGLYRATVPSHQQRRQAFLTVIQEELPILPYTQTTADWAAKLGVQASLAGETVPYVDLLIGATAMSVGYLVLTANVRHFRLIPGLEVIPF